MRAQQSATRDGLPIQRLRRRQWPEIQPAGRMERKRSLGLYQQHAVPQCAPRQVLPSIGCAPCTCAVTPAKMSARSLVVGNPKRKRCGLHVKKA